MGQRKQEKTGVYDKNLSPICVGDTIRLFNQEGTVVFESGAYGIGFKKPIDWDYLSKQIEPVTGCDNYPDFCFNDNFVSFWELLWNYNGEEDCCPVVEIIKS